jgi:hypothetical protein
LSRLEGAGVPVLEHRCGPGEHVYLRRDADRGLCFLLEGTLRVYKAYGGGGSAEATMGLLAGGGLFGEPSLRAGGRHHDSAEALSACRVARVPKGPLGAHLLREPGCSVLLLLALAEWAEEREAAARLVPWEVGGRLDSTGVSLRAPCSTPMLFCAGRSDRRCAGALSRAMSRRTWTGRASVGKRYDPSTATKPATSSIPPANPVTASRSSTF